MFGALLRDEFRQRTHPARGDILQAMPNALYGFRSILSLTFERINQHGRCDWAASSLLRGLAVVPTLCAQAPPIPAEPTTAAARMRTDTCRVIVVRMLIRRTTLAHLAITP